MIFNENVKKNMLDKKGFLLIKSMFLFAKKAFSLKKIKNEEFGGKFVGNVATVFLR